MLSGTEEGMITFVYARYDEYINEHKKIFSVEPTLVVEKKDLKISDVIQVSDDNHRVNSGTVEPCDENELKLCHIMLSKYSDNTNSIELSNIVMNNNISGNAKVTSTEGVSLDATFEFGYCRKTI